MENKMEVTFINHTNEGEALFSIYMVFIPKKGENIYIEPKEQQLIYQIQFQLLMKPKKRR